ncbi:hypothetical protein K3495_g4211 [Podosphaera aphanis]|nr:hypothetical protein K3495_g4211 [Podosphaera aphanis]
MTPLPGTPLRRNTSGRSRPTRPRSAAACSEFSSRANISSEPPLKKRRYIPGGPGGGGRYVDEDGTEIPVGGTGPGGYNYIGSRGRVGRQNAAMGLIPEVYNRRERRPRTRTILPRSQQSSMRYSSAAQAAAVVQSDAYKPREERGWEEFHPNLDIDVPLRALNATEVEGLQQSRQIQTAVLSQPSKGQALKETEGSNATGRNSNPLILGQIDLSNIRIPGTPGGGKRRPGRPPKDPVAFFTAKAAKAAKLGKGIHISPLKTPKTINQTSHASSKEKLTLPQPSYRKSNTLARFRDQASGLIRSVDKSMTNVGYQESDIFIRPQKTRIKVSDINLEDEIDFGPIHKSDGEGNPQVESNNVGRVEYDMDEQDDNWLDKYNASRRENGVEQIGREIFEITITKIEKEWHNLEKRIPKPNPKPPQTHRPRSSSAAAVNGEAQAGEEQDSKCAVCDDGDCENTNAIVFCDGCDLAVHQECYGVPFIPEGQWLCRKCQLIGRSVPTCIFCPNTDGAFKQTNASKWAHLLCAMWIPEVSLGNHTFMEPVMEVEKVPKTRWKLTCYLCNQRMGACIQCSSKSCYQAFHVTCARKARLFLKMKHSQGMLSVLDDTSNMKAFCDKHCPPEWIKENDVATASRDARAFYKKTMRGRLWADSQAAALELAANFCHTNSENKSDELQFTGFDTNLAVGDLRNKDNQPQKPIWKLPSGAPVIPFCVFEKVEKSLDQFNLQKRWEYTADVCRYWTLKREARRGAALLKRLQLQMETFSSFEITRRNFAGMGPVGRPRLLGRIEFAKKLLKDIERLKDLSKDIVVRESEKLDAAKLEADFVDTVYFPIAKLFPPIIDAILALDTQKTFTEEIFQLQTKLKARLYTTVIPFTQELSKLFRRYLSLETRGLNGDTKSPSVSILPSIGERRKLVKRILGEVVQPHLKNAVLAEAEVSCKPVNNLTKEIVQLLDSIWQSEPAITLKDSDLLQDCFIDPQITKACYGTYQSSSFEEHKEIMQHGSFGINTKKYHATPSGIQPTEHKSKLINSEINPVPISSPVLRNDSQFKPDKINIVRKPSILPDNGNGFVILPKIPIPAPPTCPVLNIDAGLNPDDVLSIGGVPWLFKDFQVQGTSILANEDTSSLNNGLSDTDEDELRGIREHVNSNTEPNATASSATLKKRKVKNGRLRR